MDDLRRHHHRHRRRRRHARPPPGAVGQAHPAARARRLAAARAAELAGAGRVRRQPLRLARHVVRRRREAVPAPDPLLRRRRDEALRRGALPAARARTSASSATTTASRRRGRSPTTSSSRTTPWPSSCTRCTAPAARIPPSRPRAPRTRSRPCRTSRASSSSPTTSPRPGYHPFHAPCGIRLTRTNMPYSACVRCQNCDGFPCAVHGKSDAEVLGVRPALEHPNVTLLHEREGAYEARDERRPGPRVTEVVVERDGATERFAGDVVVLACGAANTAKLLLMSANDHHPERARQRLRPGRPQLHVPQQPGRARALARREPDRVPEDARPERLLLRQPRPRLPAREHPDGRQVAGADVPGREAGRDEARAAVDARARRQARGRLLALDRGPAAAGQPRHRRLATAG